MRALEWNTPTTAPGEASAALERLLLFAVERGLLAKEDVPFARNGLLSALGMDAPEEEAPPGGSPLPETAEPMLASLTGYAVSRGRVPDTAEAREQFAAHLMNLLTPVPSLAARRFGELWARAGSRAATDWLYALCRANDSIRVGQIARNAAFTAPSPFGELQITINLAKPEKDPMVIALEREAAGRAYPRCMLCVENEGYAGRPGYPTHETLRTVPLTLGGEAWRLQYSPYSYYPEHCIALNELHIPMALSRRTFALLLELTDLFPHYFFGSNADLPIVGGSILSHDHFQGGRHRFPMDGAPAWAGFRHPGFPGVYIQAVRWPMTCLRLLSGDRERLADAADALLHAWRGYDDADLGVLHATGDTPHNTLTPVARRLEDGQSQLFLLLRNNRVSLEHPLGVFHPHADLHHIKKENIGLIEAMGLFILPGRLQTELSGLTAFLTGERPLIRPPAEDPLAKHFSWVEGLAAKQKAPLSQADAAQLLQNALGGKCARILTDTGVFPPTPEGDEALERFLNSIGASRA